MNNPDKPVGKVSVKIIIRTILFLALIIAVIFISAGRLDYWQGWAYVGLSILFLILSYLLLSSELIHERLKPDSGVKNWDKIFQKVSVPIFIAILVISSLDGGRFNWYPQVPFYVIIIGILGFITGQIIFLRAKQVNSYFSSVVRIQTDRGQTVCKDGPYRRVRHPGYLGSLIYSVATPLILGSFWGLIPVMISLALLIIRTQMEDKTLQNELEGYTEYTREVKYKILPGIW
ncbi:methyltransferase family protein [Methanobacterium subterraneum]|uniref:Isoprenylcysteine carboxylmethyltransferase family protein n=1 Tax=Methanobacterium subterraneum TaxID=59277 RepID=A0A7K4DK85_9EURY|nr:isoprenylcysteine carboxylmethyltransferase family protein [Methanobacterium subterraneum]NMO08225.1 isoprenylcysteine carboxylmethyltransferase family protein [Methanobacterium subterraneum]